MSFLSALENGFEVIAQCGVLFLECIGVVVLLSAAVRSIAGCLRKDPHVRLVLAQGILPWNSSWAERFSAQPLSGSPVNWLF